jgi:hypothetical protein
MLHIGKDFRTLKVEKELKAAGSMLPHGNWKSRSVSVDARPMCDRRYRIGSAK